MSGPGGRRDVDVTVHLPLLLIGLRWLLDTEQPAAALVSSRGQTLQSVGNRALRFVPRGSDGCPVVFLEVVDTNWDAVRGARDVLAASEIDGLSAMLGDCGEGVRAQWSCGLAVSAAVALASPAHPSLLAAVGRFERGCVTRTHRGRVVCGCARPRAGLRAAVSVHALHDRALRGAYTQGWSEPGETGAGPQLATTACISGARSHLRGGAALPAHRRAAFGVTSCGWRRRVDGYW